MKRILCFGDSLTWGADPNNDSRFSSDKRWTGILQNQLGETYQIIEEGLGGRTIDQDDQSEEHRNGWKYFQPCIESHLPFDVLVLLLGTNDLKEKFNKSAQEIANSLQKYFDYLVLAADHEQLTLPKVLLISPPSIDQQLVPKKWGFTNGEEKSTHVAVHYKELSDRNNSHFLDAAAIVGKGRVDGVHLDVEQNILLGKAIAVKVKSII